MALYGGPKSVLEKIQDPPVENRYNMTSTNKQYPAPTHGGWVPNINDPALKSMAARPYKMYAAGEAILGSDPRGDLVGHLHKETPLNKLFFSEANIDNLQTQIQAQVRAMSGGKYVIDRQNDDDLKIIMRSYYLMFGTNDPNFVGRELEELNGRVVGYCAAKIYSEVDFHMFYRKDIEDFAPPIAGPINTQVYGTRTGELKSFF
jgi:hypothetical protein